MSELNGDCFYVPDDGYTIQAYLNGEPQMYGPVRFGFRPVLIEERAKLMDSMGRMKPGAFDCKLADDLSKRLVEWDIPEIQKVEGRIGYVKTGKVLEITPWNILHLRWHLYNRFLAVVVFGTEGGDMDPEWAEKEKEDFSDHSYVSALTERPVGSVAEDADLKN